MHESMHAYPAADGVDTKVVRRRTRRLGRPGACRPSTMSRSVPWPRPCLATKPPADQSIAHEIWATSLTSATAITIATTRETTAASGCGRSLPPPDRGRDPAKQDHGSGRDEQHDRHVARLAEVAHAADDGGGGQRVSRAAREDHGPRQPGGEVGDRARGGEHEANRRHTERGGVLRRPGPVAKNAAEYSEVHERGVKRRHARLVCTPGVMAFGASARGSTDRDQKQRGDAGRPLDDDGRAR